MDDIGSGALVLIKQLKNKSLCFQDMVFLSLVQRVRLSIWYRELNLNGVKFPLSLRTNSVKKSVSYFALDGGATELYIMSKSRVNDILISVKKKLFVLCFECRGKAKDTT